MPEDDKKVKSTEQKSDTTSAGSSPSDLLAIELNSCVNCQHELTCGYSMLATIGKRDNKFSYGKCVLGLMSSGKPFFDKRVGEQGN